VQKAFNSEQYAAVDHRPVVADRDLIKDLSKIYKKYLRNALTPETSQKCSKPFLCISILCPLESYDINVEPAKDRVLFYKPYVISNAFEEILKDIYGQLHQCSGANSPVTALPDNAKSTAARSFDILLSRKPGGASSADDSVSFIDTVHMPADNELAERSFVHHDDGSSPGMDRSDNPWSKAKMNVRLHPSISRSRNLGAEATGDASPAHSPSTPLVPAARQQAQLLTPGLSPHGEAVYQNPGPPIPRRGPRTENDDSPPSSLTRGPTLLEGWIQARAENPSRRPDTPAEKSLNDATGSPSSPRRTEKRSDSGLESSAPPLARSQTPAIQQRLVAAFKTPRPSQFNPSPDRADGDHGHPRKIKNPSRSPVEAGSGHRQDAGRELYEILEFERQKKTISQQRKQMLRSMQARQPSIEATSMLGDENVPSVEHGGRTLDIPGAATRRENFDERFDTDSGEQDWQLELRSNKIKATNQHRGDRLDMDRGTESENLQVVTAASHREMLSIPGDDVRACLIRQQNQDTEDAVLTAAGLTRTGLKKRRIKSTRLPFETIPKGAELFHLATVLHTHISQDEQSETATATYCQAAGAERLTALDEYITQGSVNVVKWTTISQNVPTLERQLLLLLKQQDDAVTLDYPLTIAKAIKAHVDEYGD
jgi:hypothetical protein